MFIPWDKLHENEVIEFQGTETVAELRDRLETLGGSAQHLSALIIHLSDGRAVPTVVAQVKLLAKSHGRRILQKQLQELADELCPQPWEMADEPPDYRQAELEASRRRLPVILTRDGRREGLIRRARQEVTSAPERGSFDLFDRTAPVTRSVRLRLGSGQRHADPRRPGACAVARESVGVRRSRDRTRRVRGGAQGRVERGPRPPGRRYETAGGSLLGFALGPPSSLLPTG